MAELNSRVETVSSSFRLLIEYSILSKRIGKGS